eukprot:678713-Amphidinium_carterae.1
MAPRVGVKRKSLHRWALAVDEARLAALSSWEKLLLVDPEASTVGRQLHAAVEAGLAMDTLGDTVADKATGTLR